MPFLIMLSAIFAILLVTPLIKFAAVRLTLRGEIIKICKKRGFSFTPAQKRAFVGGVSRPVCDFHVETEDCVWSVKIIGFATKRAMLRFRDERHIDVGEKKPGKVRVCDIPEKKFSRLELPAYDFKYNSPAAKKPRRRLYLLDPSVYDHAKKTENALLPRPESIGRINILYAKAFLEELDGRRREDTSEQ